MKYNKMNSYVILFLVALSLTGCANPLNKATYERYKKQGMVAEQNGDVDTALIAYYRAAENVKMGNLGEKHESEALYNLGRMKRLSGQLEESAELLERTLEIDEKLYGQNNPYLLPLLTELALTYHDQNEHLKGIPLLERVEPMLPNIEETKNWQPRVFIGTVYSLYATELEKKGNKELASKFSAIAESLKK